MDERTTVDLGLGAAFGYSLADLASPAAAATAGALPDQHVHIGVTELRVHGVSGSSGPVMLNHPTVVQVGGDSTTMFYRRWTPDGAGRLTVDRPVEAYSWSGLTQSPLAAASWILLLPLALFNLAHFALPCDESARMTSSEVPRQDGEMTQIRHHAEPGRLRRLTIRLLRLIAVTATVQLTLAASAVLVGAVGAHGDDMHVPSWAERFAGYSPDVRVRIGAVGVTVVLGLLWVVSVVTGRRYEGRQPTAPAGSAGSWGLAESRFWYGRELVRRQRTLHTAAGLATLALVLARPAPHMTGARSAVAGAAGAVLALVAVTTASRVADRWHVVLRSPQPSAPGWRHPGRWCCWTLLTAAGGAAVGGLLLGGWTGEQGRAGTVTGLTVLCEWTLLAQAALWVGFAVCVFGVGLKAWWHRRGPTSEGPRRWRAAELARPFCLGQLASVLALLAVLFGGTFVVAVVLFVLRLVGTPVTDEAALADPPTHALAVPWPIAIWSVAPLGLLAGLVVGVVWALACWQADVRAVDPPRRLFRRPVGAVAEYYAAEVPGRPRAKDLAGDAYRGHRRAVARSWATARVADRAGAVGGLVALGMVTAIAAAYDAARRTGDGAPPRWWHGAAAVSAFATLLVASLLVWVMRTAFRDPSQRRTIAALWDVVTFWPRAAHPFGPPSYAERAVPELVDRIVLLTGTGPASGSTSCAAQAAAHGRSFGLDPVATVPTTTVMLTGYSQGAAIAPAVVAQLPGEARLRVGLLTLACPARRLYARAFPRYFGDAAFGTLADALSVERSPDGTVPIPPDGDVPLLPPARDCRWRNAVRRTDYIGSYVFAQPDPHAPDRHARVDQVCPDPPVLAPDADPVPPGIHAHSGFFTDPFAARIGDDLAERLAAPAGRPAHWLGELGHRWHRYAWHEAGRREDGHRRDGHRDNRQRDEEHRGPAAARSALHEQQDRPKR